MIVIFRLYAIAEEGTKFYMENAGKGGHNARYTKTFGLIEWNMEQGKQTSLKNIWNA